VHYVTPAYYRRYTYDTPAYRRAYSVPMSLRLLLASSNLAISRSLVPTLSYSLSGPVGGRGGGTPPRRRPLDASTLSPRGLLA